MKFYINGTRRGLGKELLARYGSCGSLEECDVFINCKHEGFQQVELLYKAADLNKRIINIGSNSGDGIKNKFHKYAVEKAALDKANEQLFYQGVNTTVLRFGYFDTERVSHVKEKKMSLDDVIEIIEWVLFSNVRIKEITACP